MKEFDLKLAKAGHPVCTRDGNSARIVCFDAKGDYPIVALVYYNGEEFARTFTNEGFYAAGETSVYDLIMASEVKENKDEEVRKELIQYLIESTKLPNGKYSRADFFAWLEKQGELSIYNTPAKEVILAIWSLGNEWKELTHGSISTEYGTQLEYIQKHWQESDYYPERQGEQKSAWSEEDERKLQLLIAMCDDTKGDAATYSTMYREMEELKTWLKSIKDKVQQQDTREKLVAIIDDLDKLQQKFK